MCGGWLRSLGAIELFKQWDDEEAEWKAKVAERRHNPTVLVGFGGEDDWTNGYPCELVEHIAPDRGLAIVRVGNKEYLASWGKERWDRANRDNYANSEEWYELVPPPHDGREIEERD